MEEIRKANPNAPQSEIYRMAYAAAVSENPALVTAINNP